MQRIVVAVDSFKGCLSSKEISTTITHFFAQNFPSIEVIGIPIADGGEGMVDALGDERMQRVTVEVSDPLGRKIEASYLLDSQNGSNAAITAIIEMASAAGLSKVEPELRNPCHTTTYGVGQMIKSALDRGARHFIIGIGGSATNDAGIGMLTALGYKFLNCDGCEVGIDGKSLIHLHSIDNQMTDPRLADSTIEVACDVDNPLCGPNGAAYVYAPQKGADGEMVEMLDNGLRKFAQAVKRYNGLQIEKIAGAGAAGGLGGAMVGVLGAKLVGGIDLVLQYKRFEELIAGCDLVITGEGKMDRQTVMGKAPYGILKICKKQNINVLGIAGRVEDREILSGIGFFNLIEISPRQMSLQEAMDPQTTKRNLVCALNSYFNDSPFK